MSKYLDNCLVTGILDYQRTLWWSHLFCSSCQGVGCTVSVGLRSCTRLWGLACKTSTTIVCFTDVNTVRSIVFITGTTLSQECIPAFYGIKLKCCTSIILCLSILWLTFGVHKSKYPTLSMDVLMNHANISVTAQSILESISDLAANCPLSTFKLATCMLWIQQQSVYSNIK